MDIVRRGLTVSFKFNGDFDGVRATRKGIPNAPTKAHERFLGNGRPLRGPSFPS